MTDHQDQRGQATVLVLVAVVFCGLLAAGIAQVGAAASRRASAQAAADATALAGAGAGEEAAEAVAAANDADLVTYRLDDADVVVQVERHGATASARARWVPSVIP